MDGKEQIGSWIGAQPRNKKHEEPGLYSVYSNVAQFSLHPLQIGSGSKGRVGDVIVDWDLSTANIIGGWFPPRNLD